MFLRVCVHLYPVLIWSNTNPVTVLYVPPCVLTSISCLDLEQYKPCNCSVCSSVCAYIYILSWSGAIQTLQLFCMFLRVCVHLYLVLIWSNTNPATVLYVPPCVLTSISCLGLEQYKPCNCSVCSFVCAYIYILSWSGAIQTLQLFCMFLRVCVHLYPVLIWSNTNPATVLYVPPCVRISISCLDLEQYKPCNCSVCSSVCAYIYILS